MPRQTTSTTLASRIALPYKLYFLYLDPIMATGGVYLILTDPSRFLTGTVPDPLLHSPSLSPTTITPLINLLLTNIAALYFFFAINESLVLHLTNQMSVWKAVIASLVISDVGHLYAVWAAAPERLLSVGEWTRDERVNIGILVCGLGLRLAFLAGVGVGKGR